MRKYLPWIFCLLVYTVLSFTVFPKGIAWAIRTTRRSLATTSKQLPTVGSNIKLTTASHPTPLPTQIPTPIPPSLTPVTLVIPKLKISATVEQVGQTTTGAMDVPKKAEDVAWYVYGAKPGEVGNAVINGHYDTPSGRGAVFYHLKDLVKGDDVQVLSDDGTETDFVVTDKAEVPVVSFPSEYVFFTKPGSNLNLITCDGIWNALQHNYSTRMVIYTQLKSTLPTETAQ